MMRILRRADGLRLVGLALGAAAAGCGGDADVIGVPSGSATLLEASSSELSYEVTVIPASVGRRLNASGDVVGWTKQLEPFLYTVEDGLIVLPTSSSNPGGTARDVSDRSGGEVVVVGDGRGDDFSGVRALRWRVAVPGGAILETTNLGTLPGSTASEARGLNQAGEITGNLDPNSISSRAFFYSDATGMMDLGLGGAGRRVQAHDINETGVVAGYDGSVAFRWTREGGVEYLGVPPDFAFSFGFSINGAGQVSAAVTSASGNTERIARFTDAIGWEILGGVGETNLGWGINGLGDVVGEGRVGGGIVRGVIYTDDLGTLRLLDDFQADPEPEWRVMAAFDINDNRQITGWATNIVVGGGSAVLLTPVGAAPPPPPPPPPSQRPAPPGDLGTTAASDVAIDLAWTDNDVTTEEFIIRRRVGQSGNFVVVATVPAVPTSFTDTGLLPETEYCYIVHAQNEVGHSAGSNVSCATTLAGGDPPPPPPPQRPAPPGDLAATAASDVAIDLAWTDNDVTTEEFIVRRRVGQSGSFVVIATIPATSTTYRDEGLAVGTEYCYMVHAQNEAGHSPGSNVACATTASTDPGGASAELALAGASRYLR